MSLQNADLRSLLVRATDRGLSYRQQMNACRQMGKRFPPSEHSDAYAGLLLTPDLPYDTRFLIIRVLGAVRDDPAATALAAAMASEELHSWLRMQACQRLTRINVRLARETAVRAADWLLPLVADAERDPGVLTFQEQGLASVAARGEDDDLDDPSRPAVPPPADDGLDLEVTMSRKLVLIKGGVR